MVKGTIDISTERCKGCALCTIICPKHLIMMDSHTLNAKGYHPAVLDDPNEQCTGCAVCAVICPDAAITVYREPQPVRL